MSAIRVLLYNTLYDRDFQLVHEAVLGVSVIESLL